ncbi:hypothetical protein SDC9_72831 [bioreactor metagenome]|uniref:Uncharacterized protein n=1 Tax=bioreactor metagenome TaxID=1076179 RepID=A0A644YCV8_9ZZZZ
MFAADLHGCCAEAVLGEHTRNGRALVEQEHRDILAVGLAHARLGHTNAHTGDGVQCSWIRGGKVHWHTTMSFKKT